MNKNTLLMLSIIAIFIGGFIFFTNKQNVVQTSSSKIKVNTSFYPLYFFASEIGGERAEVNNITPAGAEPHDYDPTARDIAEIEKSNLLILNGGVEAWGNKMQENLNNTPVTVVIAGKGLLTKELLEEGEKIQDPHIWLDPQLAKKEVSKITEGFITVDPSNKSFYQNNQENLDDKLDALDQKFKKGLSTCHEKDIITSHAAFGYLAARYGLNQVSISGLSPDEEPSSKQLIEVANFAKEHNIRYIFFESLVSPKLSETIAHEVGAKTLVLDPLEGISDDESKQGKNYLTVMEENLSNLQEALQCSK